MAEICQAAIHLCRVRVTRLDSLGNPVGGANNAYVTDKQISINVTPVIEAGVDRTLVGGCDCILAAYRGNDKLKRFDLELDLGLLEPALLEMMIGASVITAGGQVAGLNWPSQLDCQASVQPNVCLEGWQDAWSDDHQANSPIQYIHWVWPATRWQIGPHQLQNDFLLPKLMGFTRSNPLWGLGIYGDTPQAIGAQGGFFYTNQLPTAFCDYVTEGLT